MTAYVASASSNGEQLIIKDLIPADDTAWNAGESILLTADKTKNLLGISDVSSAAEKSTPVEIGIYHTPSTNVIYHAAILIE